MKELTAAGRWNSRYLPTSTYSCASCSCLGASHLRGNVAMCLGVPAWTKDTLLIKHRIIQPIMVTFSLAFSTKLSPPESPGMLWLRVPWKRCSCWTVRLVFFTSAPHLIAPITFVAKKFHHGIHSFFTLEAQKSRKIEPIDTMSTFTQELLLATAHCQTPTCMLANVIPPVLTSQRHMWHHNKHSIFSACLVCNSCVRVNVCVCTSH